MRKIVQCSITVAMLGFLAGCAPQIKLPGTVLPVEQEPVAVEGMGPPVNWRPVDASTGQITDIAGLEALVEDFPDSASVRLRLLAAHFVAEDAPPTFDDVEWLFEHGYTLSEGAQNQLQAFFEANDSPAAASGMQVMRAVAAAESAARSLGVPASEIVATAPPAIHLPEAALWDERNRRLFLTSIVSRGLYAQDAGGDWSEVPLAGVGSLAGIALDAPRGLIWVGSGVVDPTPDPGIAFRGMIAIDRITLEERRRVAAPEGASISDIAVGPDGTIYGSDPIGGGIYFATITDAAMQTFIAPGTFRSPQGIAVRPDNSALYVSDYRYGLAQVMLRSRQAYRMRAAQPMLLDGVDGLWLHGNELIAVQNGLSPMRITAFALGQGIGVIASHRTLEMDNPEWTEPLGGAIAEGALYYIGTGQWDLWGEGGVLREGAEPRSSMVHRLHLADSPHEQP